MDTTNLPQVYRKDPPFTISYDFTDVLNNYGYLTLYGGTATAESTTYESYTSGDDSDYSIDNNDWAAQTFTIGTTGTDEDFYVHAIRIAMDVGAITTTEVRCEIQEVTAGEPNGTVKIRFDGPSGYKVDDSGSSTKQWFEFNISDMTYWDGKKLEAGTQYAIVLYNYVDASAYTIRFDNADGSYSGGQRLSSADSGSNWTAQTGDDILFKVIGSPDCSPFTLIPAQFKTATASTSMSIVNPGDDLVDTGTITFLSSINRSAIINGFAFLDLDITCGADIYEVTADLYHVVNSTDTIMGTAKSLLSTDAIAMQMYIDKTVVNSGDKLKLVLTFYCAEHDAGTYTTVLNHDPAGTDLKLMVPFKIQT